MKEKLSRSITTLGFSVLAINGFIGAGIFLLPAAAAESTGSFSPWMFVICGLLMSTIVLSFAQLASYYRGTGGPVLYANEAFGPLVGFQTGWLLYVGRVTALAANSNALIIYLSFLFPIFSDGIMHGFALSAVILLLTASNVFGVRSAMGTISVLTFLKLAPLLLFIVVGLAWIDVDQIFSVKDAPLDKVSTSLLLLVYAFVGFEGAVVPAGEAKDPKKSIPRALIQSVIFTIILYFLVQSITVSVLEQAGSSKAPLSDAAGVMFGSWGVLLLTITAILSITGNLAATFFAAPRMTYALANEKSLPAWFGKINEKYKVPANSIYFMSALALVLAISGSFVWLAIISSLARLIGFAVCMLALIKLKSKQDGLVEKVLQMFVPLLGLSVCIWLSTQASNQAWMLTLGFIVLGTGLYYLARIKR
ncbi:MAG: hypothetical protein COA74_11985 [Gammaproteobacteria bacterium]|nr:MAG: hypothetical protein COA74_11985 [Gammaproteobacteria bacterium]